MEAEPNPLEATGVRPLVRSRVAVTRRGLLSVHWFQGLCVGVAAALVAFAVGVYEEAGAVRSPLFFVAAVNGVLVLLLWAWTHRPSAAQVARDVDRALGENGALFTAWEIESQVQPSALAQRLAQEVAGAVPPGRMLRSILPVTLPFIAAPFAGCALLFAVMEDARQDPIQENIAGLVDELQAGIGTVSSDAPGPGEAAGGALSALERQELQQLMRDVGELGEELRDGQATPEEIEGMLERVAELGERLSSASSEELKRGLERTQGALDSARMSLETEDSSGGKRPTNQESGGGKGSSGGTGLANSDEEGRMGGQNPPPARAAEAPQPGVLGSPSWPQAYDGIIRRWVESARQ